LKFLVKPAVEKHQKAKALLLDQRSLANPRIVIKAGGII
jgi:hypothetical protein